MMLHPNSILLVTEGTYPGALGGVSEWCHRLITGMPNVDFKIISITHNNRQNKVERRRSVALFCPCRLFCTLDMGVN